ncbi:MAG: class I tRNA ligase family protein [Chloroflexia bacterium]
MIDPTAMVDRFGTEALRYWLQGDMPRTEDADFTFDRLAIRYNTDLANDLGNLLNRTVSMIVRYRQGWYRSPAKPPTPSASSSALQRRYLRRGIRAGRLRLSAALAALELVLRANRHVEESALRTLSKAERAGDEAAGARLDTTLYTSEALRLLSYQLAPFLPSTSEVSPRSSGSPQAGAPRGRSLGRSDAGAASRAAAHLPEDRGRLLGLTAAGRRCASRKALNAFAGGQVGRHS